MEIALPSIASYKILSLTELLDVTKVDTCICD